MTRFLMGVLVALTFMALASAGWAASSNYLPNDSGGPRYTGSCGWWNTWAGTYINGRFAACYPDGYWHYQYAGHDLGGAGD